MLTVGSKLGHYEITGLIGTGGMGEVYRARDPKLDREVAIKVLPTLAAADSEQLARFEREAHVLAALNHPNIAAIYGLEETGGVPALVLELVAGSTLKDRLAHGPLPVGEALRVAQQIATGLQAAHEQGIVHRDLKPGNVVVRADGLVKLLDFGLAKLSDARGMPSEVGGTPTVTTDATRQGVILGTPAYMAPEQISGRAVDKSIDIWAFGAVLFELLSGQRPFHGLDSAAVQAAILRDEPRWTLLPGDTPASIRRLLQRCLAKDPRARLHDLGDARLEIEDELASSPHHSAAVSTVPSARVSRRAVTIGLAVLVVLTAAALGALGDRFLSTGPSEGRETGAGSTLPLVIMMDSSHPRRVYDEETRAASGTNADVISDLLSDLPIRRQKETIGPEWHRDEEIRQFQPDLIVIHYSGFNQDDNAGPRTRLKLLIQFLADTPVRFLIYSRVSEDVLNSNLATLLDDLYGKHPGLQQRIRGFGLPDHGPPRWIRSVTGTELKLVVKEMLNLP